MFRFRFATLAIMATFTITSLAFSGESETRILINPKIIQLTDAQYKEMAKTWQFAETHKATILSADELKKLESDIIQNRIRTLSSPNLAALDGKDACVQVGGKIVFTKSFTVTATAKGHAEMVPQNGSIDLGMSLKICPKLIPDKNKVQLKYHYSNTEIESNSRTPVTIMVDPAMVTPAPKGQNQASVPFTAFVECPVTSTISSESTVEIGIGGTVVVYLGSQNNSHAKDTVPMMSHIPYLNRLFHNVSSEPCLVHHCMIVTANVVEQLPKRETNETRVQAQATTPTSPTLVFASGTVPVPPSGLQVTPFGLTHMPSPHTCRPLETLVAQQPTTVIPKIATVVRKNDALLRTLINHYDQLCKAGDYENAKLVAAHCLELDPACFMKR